MAELYLYLYDDGHIPFYILRKLMKIFYTNKQEFLNRIIGGQNFKFVQFIECEIKDILIISIVGIVCENCVVCEQNYIE